jgi:hypothetical protein
MNNNVVVRSGSVACKRFDEPVMLAMLDVLNLPCNTLAAYLRCRAEDGEAGRYLPGGRRLNRLIIK